MLAATASLMPGAVLQRLPVVRSRSTTSLAFLRSSDVHPTRSFGLFDNAVRSTGYLTSGGGRLAVLDAGSSLRLLATISR